MSKPRRTFKHVVFGVCTAVLVTLAVAIAILKASDFNEYRDLLEDQVRALTGRELKLEGRLQLEFSLEPILVVEGLRFANAAWGSQSEMLRAQRLEARVALLPLFVGTVRVRRVLLHGVDLLLENDSEGRQNWVFDETAAADEGAASWGVLPVLSAVQLRDVTVTLRDAVSQRLARVSIDRAALASGGDGLPLHTEAVGVYNGIAFELSARTTALRALARGAPLEVDCRLRMLGGEQRASGRVLHPVSGAGIELRIRASGNNLADLSPALGFVPPAVGPYALDFRLKDQDGALLLDEIEVSAGASRAKGKLTVRPGALRPLLELDLDAEVIDLRELLPHSPPEGEPERVFSAEPWALKPLRGWEADLALRCGSLLTRRGALSQVAAKGTLRGGKLRLEPLSFGLGGGKLRGRLALDAAAEPPALHVALKGEEVEVRALLQGTEAASLIEGRARLALDLRAAGASSAELAGRANGRARLLMGPGQARAAGLETVVGGASKVLGTLFAESSEDAKVNCAAASFRIEDGLATVQALLIDTEYSTVKGRGTINLGDESLDLVLSPYSKSVTISVAVPVEVGGTLSEPTYTPETFATARKIGGLLGIIVYPPAAVAGLAELGTGDDNPCLALLSGDGEPESEQESSELRRAVEGIGRKLRGLFGE